MTSSPGSNDSSGYILGAKFRTVSCIASSTTLTSWPPNKHWAPGGLQPGRLILLVAHRSQTQSWWWRVKTTPGKVPNTDKPNQWEFRCVFNTQIHLLEAQVLMENVLRPVSVCPEWSVDERTEAFFYCAIEPRGKLINWRWTVGWILWRSDQKPEPIPLSGYPFAPPVSLISSCFSKGASWICPEIFKENMKIYSNASNISNNVRSFAFFFFSFVFSVWLGNVWFNKPRHSEFTSTNNVRVYLHIERREWDPITGGYRRRIRTADFKNQRVMRSFYTWTLDNTRNIRSGFCFEWVCSHMQQTSGDVHTWCVHTCRKRSGWVEESASSSSTTGLDAYRPLNEHLLLPH